MLGSVFKLSPVTGVPREHELVEDNLFINHSSISEYIDENNGNNNKVLEEPMSNVSLSNESNIISTQCNIGGNNNFRNYNYDTDHTVQTTKLKIIVWNIQGLSDKLESKSMLHLISKFDIIIFLETMKLDSYIPDIGDYTYKHFQRKHQNKRARKPSGGIGILIKTDLVRHVSIVKHNDFTVWLRIASNPNNHVYIGAVYIPPQDSSSTYSNFANNNAFQLLQQDVTHFSSIGSVCICGDFNARTGNNSDNINIPGRVFDRFDEITQNMCFPNNSRYSEDTKINTYGRELLSLCKSSKLRIMNGYFNNDISSGCFTCCTPRGTSLIDYLICDFKFYTSLIDFSLLPLCVDSDHRALTFSLRIVTDFPPSANHCQKDSSSHVLAKPHYRYVFKVEDVPNYKTSLQNDNNLKSIEAFSECIISDGSVDEAVSCIYQYIENAVAENFSIKYQKSASNSFPSNPWFDDQCKAMKRNLNDYSKSCDLNLTEDRNLYFSMKKSYKSLTQRKKREYQKGIRDQLDNFHSQNQNDYWKFWDSLKDKKKVSRSKPRINLSNFQDYFTSIQSPPTDAINNFDMTNLDEALSFIEHCDFNIQCDNISDPPITLDEVNFQINNLKLNKAPGIDGICNEFFKCASKELAEPLTILFNFIWDKGTFPDKWSEGLIQPLHKKGSVDFPDNYRKLTLMACMGKIFEAILNKRLIAQSEILQANDPNQFGFCKNHRTTDNLFIIDTLISFQKQAKKPLFITFIDFTKAFDFVNRDLLYYKLLKTGFSRKLVKIIMSLLTKASARVRWDGALGEKIDSTHGVLQGGIISPKLFNFFLADLKESLNGNFGITINGTNFTHLVYADDLVLVSQTNHGMQLLLNNLENYCRKWHLIVNSQKTKVMIFNKKKNDNIKFMLEKEQLEIVDTYKYLGHVLCTSRNIHTQMHQTLAVQGQRSLHLLYNNIKSTVGYLSPTLAIKMFDSHVLPILEYNSEIWFSIKKVNEIEKIQLKFLKNILGVRNQTSTIGLLADTGRFPMLTRQHISVIKYLDRMNNFQCPKLVRQCFEIQKQLHQSKSTCWYSRLVSMLCNYDIDITQNLDLKFISSKIYDKSQAYLFQEINDSDKQPKLRTYRNIKKDMRIEPYLNLGLPKSVYCYIARFRLSSHNLSIELGRHKRPFVPAEERLCDKCTLNVVGDELHCLMICPRWVDIRRLLIKTACNEIPNFLILSVESQFQEILCHKTIEMNHALGQFLYTALKI